MEVALRGDTEQPMFSKYIVYEFHELGQEHSGKRLVSLVKWHNGLLWRASCVVSGYLSFLRSHPQLREAQCR